MKAKSGQMESVWPPNTLHDIAEETRKRLGINRSSFYRYAFIRLQEDMNVFSQKASGGLVE